MINVLRMLAGLMALIAIQVCAQTVEVRVPGMNRNVQGAVGVPMKAISGQRHGMNIRDNNLGPLDYLLYLDSSLPITVGAFEFDEYGLYVQPSKFTASAAGLSRYLSIHTVIEYIDGYRLYAVDGIKPMDLLGHYFYGREALAPGMENFAYIEYRTWREIPNPKGSEPLVVFDKDSDGKDLRTGMIVPLWHPDPALLKWRQQQRQGSWSAQDRMKLVNLMMGIGFWVAIAEFGSTDGIVGTLRRWDDECKEEKKRYPLNLATC